MNIDELLNKDITITISLDEALSILFDNETLVFQMSDDSFLIMDRNWSGVGWTCQSVNTIEKLKIELNCDGYDLDDFVDVCEYTDYLPENFKKVLVW